MDSPFFLGGAFGAIRALRGHVTLHNSLCVRTDDDAFRAGFRIVAEAENSVLVAVSKQAPWLLCQFHPESFGSTAGLPFLEAFVSQVSSPKATSL
jgi:anthranilate/para-aminobenzoate synthase component II